MFHPLINLLITLVLIVLLIRKKVPLGYVMSAAGILLGLLFKVSLSDQLVTVKRAIISQEFLQLGIALNTIVFLEHILRTKGYLNKTLGALRRLIPNIKINMMLLPAFLGLLPSPGGALFSAPLVAEAGKELDLSPELKSRVNYWFRHIWEYFFPLYPGIILSAQILAVPVARISQIMSWFIFICIIIGYLLIMRRLKVPLANEEPISFTERKRYLQELLAGIWPVIAIVLVVLIFHADVGLTVIGFIVLLLFLNRYRLMELKTLWRESFSLSLIYLIAGILFFKGMLGTSGVVEWLPGYLQGIGIPNLLVVVSLPFLVAFLVGLSQAYIAATFPLLLGIIGTGAGLHPGMLVLALVSGFVGVMLSPVHLCLILTVDYYQANFLKVWRSLILPETIVLAAGFLFALFWK